MWASVMALIAAMAYLWYNTSHAGEVADVKKQVATLNAKIDEVRISQIEKQIFDQKIQQCMAEGELRTVYAGELARLIGQWRILAMSPYDPPTLRNCDELGIRPNATNTGPH